MKLKAMNQTSMLGTKMGAATSMIGTIVAWLPHVETAMRIGASAIAIVAGIYAILNYRADLKAKNHEKNKASNRNRNDSGHHRRLHDD